MRKSILLYPTILLKIKIRTNELLGIASKSPYVSADSTGNVTPHSGVCKVINIGVVTASTLLFARLPDTAQAQRQSSQLGTGEEARAGRGRSYRFPCAYRTNRAIKIDSDSARDRDGTCHQYPDL